MKLWSVLVRCKVVDLHCDFLIDTGSKVSLVKESALMGLDIDWKKIITAEGGERLNLVGITGSSIQTKGKYKIRFQMGKTKFGHPCFVCTDEIMLHTSGFIGQELLRTQNIDVLTSEASIMVRSERIPILNWKEPVTSCSSSTPAPVRIIEECLVPPMSEVVVSGRVDPLNRPGEMGVIEATVDTNGIAGAHSLVRVSNEGDVSVRTANYTLADIGLPKNKAVALFIDAEYADSAGVVLQSRRRR